MGVKYKKITVGFVIQQYDENDDCISSEFIAGDEVEYEGLDGEVIYPQNENYFGFDMVQPIKQKYLKPGK